MRRFRVGVIALLVLSAASVVTIVCNRRSTSPRNSRDISAYLFSHEDPYCVDAQSMKGSVSEARTVLRSYFDGQFDIPLWSLIARAKIVPERREDMMLLGDRKPFVFLTRAGEVAQLRGDSDKCATDARPPDCSSATFPLLFNQLVGHARVYFSQAIKIAMRVNDAKTVVDFLDGGVRVETIGVGTTIPPRVWLRRVSLSENDLFYKIALNDATEDEIEIRLILNGKCK